MLARLVADDRARHLGRRDAVGEARTDERAGRDADRDRDVVEVEPVERVVERAQDADLVDGAFGAAAGEGEADASAAVVVGDLHGGSAYVGAVRIRRQRAAPVVLPHCVTEARIAQRRRGTPD